MPKYWGKQIFAHGRFPEVGQKQKTEKKERERERLSDGNNNGQATHGARKHAWRTQAAWAKREKKRERLNDSNNNGQLRIANATSGGARKAAWANSHALYILRKPSLQKKQSKLELFQLGEGGGVGVRRTAVPT